MFYRAPDITGWGYHLTSSIDYLIREIEKRDIEWVRETIIESWRSTRVVSRGVIHNTEILPGFIAEANNQRVGLLTYTIDNEMLEIVTLNVFKKREGIGRKLVDRSICIAKQNDCSRVWVITTNDNTPALQFYQSVGFTLVAVHKGAIRKSRKLKSEIPFLGIDNIPITDEIELEMKLKS